jgi:hypothetical protein
MKQVLLYYSLMHAASLIRCGNHCSRPGLAVTPGAAGDPDRQSGDVWASRRGWWAENNWLARSNCACAL